MFVKFTVCGLHPTVSVVDAIAVGERTVVICVVAVPVHPAVFVTIRLTLKLPESA